MYGWVLGVILRFKDGCSTEAKRGRVKSGSEHMHAIVEENGAECDRDNCTALAVRTHTARGMEGF